LYEILLQLETTVL